MCLDNFCHILVILVLSLSGWQPDNHMWRMSSTRQCHLANVLGEFMSPVNSGESYHPLGWVLSPVHSGEDCHLFTQVRPCHLLTQVRPVTPWVSSLEILDGYFTLLYWGLLGGYPPPTSQSTGKVQNESRLERDYIGTSAAPPFHWPLRWHCQREQILHYAHTVSGGFRSFSRLQFKISRCEVKGQNKTTKLLSVLDKGVTFLRQNHQENPNFATYNIVQ